MQTAQTVERALADTKRGFALMRKATRAFQPEAKRTDRDFERLTKRLRVECKKHEEKYGTDATCWARDFLEMVEYSWDDVRRQINCSRKCAAGALKDDLAMIVERSKAAKRH